MGLVTYSELANKLNKSRAYISKLKKKGVFDDCVNGKKIDYDCAIEAIKNNVKDFKKVDVKKLANKNTIKENLPKNLPKELPITDEMMEELENLLLDVSNPSQKVAIIKDFWIGKINQLKYEVEKGKYYSKEIIDKKAEHILVSFRNKTLAMPSKVAPTLVGIEDAAEIKAILDNAVYELLDELSRLEDITEC